MEKLLLLLALIFSINAFSQVDLLNVKPWAYQLQDNNITQIANDGSFELLVMDYSQDGMDAGKFTSQQIDSIKNSGKYAISYISVGEAEDYRYYWDNAWNTSPPAWLGPENPDWAGNYKVRFWYPEWQNIIFDYIDTIISQGFDGIYMDIIDGYYYWAEEDGSQPYADSLMCQFVINIRNYVNTATGNNNFIVIPQNGEDVWDQVNVSTTLKNTFFDAINAIGIEDVFFYGDFDENNTFNADYYRLSMLEEYQARGKQIYSIEYLTNGALIQQYIDTIINYDFVPYVCIRELNQLCGGISTNINKIVSYDAINIFPNPSNGIFYIKGKDIKSIEIINLYGQIFFKTKDKSKKTKMKINLSPQQKGVYFVKIYKTNSIITRKLIIQ